MGVNGVCVVSQGRADRQAICKAIEVAAGAVEHEIIEQIRQSVHQLAELQTSGQVLSGSE